MSLSDLEIVDYLKTHPDFFERHPEFKPSVSNTPQVVSLTERQLPVLRDRIRALEDQIKDLIDIAKDNDALSDKVQHFAVRLLSHKSNPELKPLVLQEIKTLFGIDHAIMRLWAHAESSNEAPVLQEFRDFVTGMTEPVCGEHPLYEVNRWFGDAAADIKSYAVAPIGEPAFGVLVLGGNTAERFAATMGTLFLTRLTRLIGAALQGEHA